MVSRLIEGEYFKVDQMLSSDYATKISVNKKEFLDCIERASILIRENDKKPIILNIEESKMALKLNSSFGTMNADHRRRKCDALYDEPQVPLLY